MDRFREAVDRHITGNYGENQFKCEHIKENGESAIKKEHISTFGDKSREAFICSICDEEIEEYDYEVNLNNQIMEKCGK